MKTKQILAIVLTATLYLQFLQTYAQEYKVNANSQSRLVLEEINKVTIEGYNGSELVFTVANGKHKRPERAEGLTAISGLGLEDNTGIGLAVRNEGNDIKVATLSRRGGPSYKIRVPENMSIVYTHSSAWGSTLSLSNITGELEISTNHNSIDMVDVTGPMTVKTVHGRVDAKFSNGVKNPISVISTHGLVDVSLPASIKANIEMMSKWGEMYTNMDIAFDKSAEELRKLSSSVIKGTINGGGDVTIELSSSHGNIYLRKL